MNLHELETKIDRIEKFILTNQISQKEILSVSEASVYMEISMSYLYKLTSKNEIPFSKPMNKLIYFKKTDLDAWMLSNRKQSKHEIVKDFLTIQKHKNWWRNFNAIR